MERGTAPAGPHRPLVAVEPQAHPAQEGHGRTPHAARHGPHAMAAPRGHHARPDPLPGGRGRARRRRQPHPRTRILATMGPLAHDRPADTPAPGRHRLRHRLRDRARRRRARRDPRAHRMLEPARGHRPVRRPRPRHIPPAVHATPTPQRNTRKPRTVGRIQHLDMDPRRRRVDIRRRHPAQRDRPERTTRLPSYPLHQPDRPRRTHSATCRAAYRERSNPTSAWPAA